MTDYADRYAELAPDEVHTLIGRKAVQLAAVTSGDLPIMLELREEYRCDRKHIRSLMTDIEALLKRADEIIGETAG